MSAGVNTRAVDPVGDGDNALGLSLYHLNALAGDTFADGQGRWLDTSTYVFTPKAGLAPSTGYSVRVAAGLQDFDADLGCNML